MVCSRTELDQKARAFSMLQPQPGNARLSYSPLTLAFFGRKQASILRPHRFPPVSDRHHPHTDRNRAARLAAVRGTQGRQCAGAGARPDAGLAVRDQAAALATRLRRRACGSRHFPCGSRHAASDSLATPWPDIVIGIGYRSAPVSRWIGQQAGRVINIRLGRPRTDLKPYDLVITTPQYGLPPAPNVRELPLPLVKADDGAMAKAIARWRSEFERLPAPRVAVLLGGPTQHMAFDDAVARTLARDLQAFAARTGGSLLITSSPRSPAGLKAILRPALSRRRISCSSSRRAATIPTSPCSPSAMRRSSPATAPP